MFCREKEKQRVRAEGFLQNKNEQSWTSQKCEKLIESWSKLLWKGLETPSLASEFAKASVQCKRSPDTLRWLLHSVTVNSEIFQHFHYQTLQFLPFPCFFSKTWKTKMTDANFWGQSWCGHWVLHLVFPRCVFPRLASKEIPTFFSAWEIPSFAPQKTSKTFSKTSLNFSTYSAFPLTIALRFLLYAFCLHWYPAIFEIVHIPCVRCVNSLRCILISKIVFQYHGFPFKRFFASCPFNLFC